MKKIIYMVLALVGTYCLGAKAQITDSMVRVVKLEGASNFRDVGGYTTNDGKKVKWGKVYRSAAIDKLTDNDLNELKNRNINMVVDFRGNAEAAKAPDILPENTSYLLLPAGSGSNDLSAVFGQVTSGEAVMKRFYANTEALEPRYKPFFQQLLQLPDTSALLYHCTAGKDRTGIATALFLYTLGVDKEQIIQDYEATNVYWKAGKEQNIQHMEQLGLSRDIAEDIMAAKKPYLESLFAALDQQYGSIANFLDSALGLDSAAISRLKQLYTE